jgi:hypothetical protein
MSTANGTPSLNELLLARMAEAGVRSQAALTVMAPHRDPYRLEKYRPEAEWLAAAMAKIAHRPLHVRGLHYAAIGTTKPDGTPYENTQANADWIGDKPAKAVRWLGLVPFTDIIDKKNEEPRVEIFESPDPQPVIRLGRVELTLPEELAPQVGLQEFRGAQPYKLVIFAEKAAVGPVVLPLAEKFGADAYIMAGEISDTHLYAMARIGAADGRPMAVLTLSDADPAGYWMPSTIAWKLGALRDGWFPELRFEVHPIGFLPEQVHAINANGTPLPSSPLKEGERRAGAWEEVFGIEPVEIDAIATLRPDVLRDIVRRGIEPFFDKSLDRRVRERKQEWLAAAQPALEAQLGPELIEELRSGVEEKLVELEGLADQINEQLWVPTDGVRLPELPPIPEPKLNGVPLSFASSDMGYVEFVRTLKARGAYAREGGRR